MCILVSRTKADMEKPGETQNWTCETPASHYNTNPMTSSLQFDSSQFLPLTDEKVIRHPRAQTQAAAHGKVSAFTLVTANSLVGLWHVCVFMWTVARGHLYFRKSIMWIP